MAQTPLPIAFPVDNLDAARTLDKTTLGSPAGRSSAQWIDLFGHPIVAQLSPSTHGNKAHHIPVDGHEVPVPHFDVMLPIET